MGNSVATTRRDSLRLTLARHKSLMRFSIVGLFNTSIDFLLFLCLMRVIGVNYLIAQTISYAFGVVNSFIMNKTWTFDTARLQAGISTQFLQFVALNLLSLAISLVGLKILSGHLGINIYPAKIMVTVITWSIRYIGYKYWIFDTRRTLKAC